MATATRRAKSTKRTAKTPKAPASVIRTDANQRVAFRPQADADSPPLDDAWFLGVKSGQVIFKAKTREEGWKLLEQFPGSVLCSREDSHPKRAAQHPEPADDNPVAGIVKNLSRAAGEKVIDVLHEVVGACTTVDHGVDGTTWHVLNEEDDSGEYRTATNAEAAEWYFTLEVGAVIDLRQSMPTQVAAWLKRRADELNEAAAKIEAMPDERNVRMVRKVVNDAKFVQSLIAERMTLDEAGKQVPDEYAEYREQYRAKRKLEPQRVHYPIEVFSGVCSHQFGVVDKSRIQNVTDNISQALAFAAGRGGDSMVIGIPSDEMIAIERSKSATLT